MLLCLHRIGATLVNGHHLIDCWIILAFALLVWLRALRTVRQKAEAAPYLECLHCSLGSRDALYSKAVVFGEWLICCSHTVRLLLVVTAVKYNPPILQKGMVRHVEICV